MATHAALSHDFDRARLDALGLWSVDANADNLDINWPAPPELAGMWVPLRLRFHTDSGSKSFDPDDRMFELYVQFVAGKERYCEQVRKLVAELGEVRHAVVVFREGDEGDGDNYALSVWFHMSNDTEHLYQADHDASADAFTSLSG